MKDLTKILKYCGKYLNLHLSNIIPYCIVAFIYYMMLLAEPYIFGSFVEILTNNTSISFIVQYCCIYLLIAVVGYISSYFVKITGTKLNVDICQDFKVDMLEHIQNTPLSYTNSIDKAKFTHKINNDIQLLIGFILNILQTVLGKIACLIVPYIYILRANLKLGLLLLIIFPLMIIIYKVFEKKLFITASNYMNAQTSFFQKLEEQLFDVKYIKLNNASGILKERFINSGKLLKSTAVTDEKVSFLYWLSSNNMDIFFKIFFLLYGGIAIIQHRMNIGTFIIITSYLPMITNSFMYLLDLGKEIQQGKVYYTRLKEISDVEEDHNGTILLDDISKVELKHVNFNHGKMQIISNFSYTFKKGYIYTIIGDNGSGKSTLVNLILGLYINEFTGEITYNDITIQDIDMKRTRESLVGVAEQEPSLLADSIKYNITYNNVSNDESQIKKYIDAVKLSDYLENCENGLDTIVNENSTNLSGGQKQKISIVRALFKEPKLLVLDEPTSALDKESKKAFLNYIHTNKKEKITIIVTHDPEFIKISDFVVDPSHTCNLDTYDKSIYG